MTNAGNEGCNFRARLGQKPGDHLSLNIWGKGGKMNVKRFFIAALMLLPALYLHSCCLIGLGIGAISDAQKKDSLSVPMERLAAVKSGERILLVLNDGQRLKGKFIRFRRLLQRDYATRYFVFVRHRQLQSRVPRLYEDIGVFSAEAKQVSGRFLGFDKENLFLLKTDQTELQLPLTDVQKISAGGRRVFSLPTIRAVVQQADFPVFTEAYLDRQATLALMVDNNLRSFPAEAIERVNLLPRKNGKLIGFLIGAGLDAAFVIYTINQLSHMPLGMNLGPL